MKFRFVHAADLHLGSPLLGLSVKDAQVAERIALASRTAFTTLVSRAILEEVAFVVLAGDIYDGEWKDTAIGLFFAREVARLDRAGIPVFMIRGNHDAESVVTRAITLPDSVRLFSASRPETVRLDRFRVALHGQSFADREVFDNLAAAYPPAVAGWFNIGLLHTALDRQSTAHAPYARCTPAELAARGYDYWALGHLHRYEVVSLEPYIVYPGNIQGRSIRECGPKGAVLVEVEDQVVTGLAPFVTATAEWAELDLDLTDVHDEADAYRRADETFGELAVGTEDRLLAVRVRLHGTTPLHRRFAARREELHAEILAAGQRRHPDLWLEKVVLATRDPTVPSAARGLDGLDLSALLAGLASDPALREMARAETERIEARLGDLTTAEPLAPDLDEVLAEAQALVLGRAAEEG